MAHAAAMQDADIYVKTDAGRDEIKSRALGLPMSIRAILLMVDGQRTVSAMRGIIAGSKAPADVLDSLVAQGLIEPVAAPQPAPARPAPPPAPIPAAVAPTPMPVAPAVAAKAAAPAPPVIAPPPPVAVTPVVPAPAPATAPPVAADASTLYDGPLDLTLPTIYGPESFPAPEPRPAQPVQPAPILDSVEPAPVANQYERLYAMMNEIVRDFLAPHRRYFFQLKIERCTTADELLELLYDLQTALSKSRGDAFATDVISRLRNAAV